MTNESSLSDPASATRDDAPATQQGLSFSRSLAFSLVCLAGVLGGSYGVASDWMSTGVKGALSILTLLSLVGLGYFVFQLVLALVATTGERRWSAREISERRTGERARK